MGEIPLSSPAVLRQLPRVLGSLSLFNAHTGIWRRFPAIASAGSASPLSCTVKLSMLPEVEA
jgi:hypothetical protein